MIPVLVEGEPDAVIAARLLALVGLEIGQIYGRRGKDHLDNRLPSYNQAARYSKWLVLRDLNGDAACAAELVADLLGRRSQGLCLRIAVRASEAWLMADKERISAFLSVPANRVPLNPDALANPKREMVNLARHSRRRAIREDMVPELGVSSQVGPAYTSRLVEFASTFWRPQVAAIQSESLARSIAALERWAA